jgi:hypothetical protein
MEVFAKIPKDAPVFVAEGVWQYTHHVLAGLTNHRGPILTVWQLSGQWPGLVCFLNLNGSLTRADIPYSNLWSMDFRDEFFCSKLKNWLQQGNRHSRSFSCSYISDRLCLAFRLGVGSFIAEQILHRQAILGVLDEGCMGMYNAIVPDELLHRMGTFKERLSQSSLYYEVTQTTDEEGATMYA